MYLFDGKIMETQEPTGLIATLRRQFVGTLTRPHDPEHVLDCAQRFADHLVAQPTHPLLDAPARAALISFCQREALQEKLERELGIDPFSLRRVDYQRDHFESWQPLGLVVHITPANAPLLPFMAIIESLLVGNVNWLRPSTSDRGFTARLIADFLEHDMSGRLAEHVAVLPLETSDLGMLLANADAVSAWGGDAALNKIRAQLPVGCRWIDWGHRISFSYLSPKALNDDMLDALVDDVCRFDQQACSSPQCLMVDSDDPETLRRIGTQLAAAFRRRTAMWPALVPDTQENAEITTEIIFQKLDQTFACARGEVWQGAGWRVVWRDEQELAASPLFRTLQLRPAPRDRLSTILSRSRTRLQTCGLIAAPEHIGALSRALLAAGVSRITPVGRMHDGYHGEPHDGVYALARLAKRASVTLSPGMLSGYAHLDEPPKAIQDLTNLPVMGKEQFQTAAVDQRAQLFFRSGGSSGAPKLAAFSYRDYRVQMRAAADGLFSAGLNPAADRVMNLFYGGRLYGGMLSFFSILEALGVPQFPMGGPADADYKEIAQFIVQHGVNTLVGMPSTLHRLFESEEVLLRRYAGIKKLFFGGEHVNAGQRRFFEGFGVTLIRSAMYGSVDAGPLGHACSASPDGVFHLLARTQWLEILRQDSDEPAAIGETGRLVFTSRQREAQYVRRYDLGDLGRWIPRACACGLPTPIFELTGRHGSLLRAGTIFINVRALTDKIGVPLQWLVENTEDGKDRIRILAAGIATDQLRQQLLNDSSHPLLEQVIHGGLLELDVVATPSEQFRCCVHSGKTPLVIDLRHG